MTAGPAQKILFTKTQIQQRIMELASEIATEYQGKSLLIVGVLKGSYILMADLTRALFEQGMTDVIVDFITISTYGSSTQYPKSPQILSDVATDVKGKNILLVEDIYDTGHTLHFVQQILLERNPASLKTLVLLSKPARRKIEVKVDYIGFKLQESPWVEGYGLDSNGKGRNRPEIVEKTIL